MLHSRSTCVSLLSVNLFYDSIVNVEEIVNVVPSMNQLLTTLEIDNGGLLENLMDFIPCHNPGEEGAVGKHLLWCLNLQFDVSQLELSLLPVKMLNKVSSFFLIHLSCFDLLFHHLEQFMKDLMGCSLLLNSSTESLELSINRLDHHLSLVNIILYLINDLALHLIIL